MCLLSFIGVFLSFHKNKLEGSGRRNCGVRKENPQDSVSVDFSQNHVSRDQHFILIKTASLGRYNLESLIYIPGVSILFNFRFHEIFFIFFIPQAL